MSGAAEYAKALLMLTEECGTSDRCAPDARLLVVALSENPEYTRLLDSPAVPLAKKLSLLDEAFGSIEENLLKLLKLLTERRLARLILKVVREYISEYDELRGIERVEAISAVPLTEAQRCALCKRLTAKTGKTVVLENTVDPKILGGMKLRYMGKQVDGSLESRLLSLEKNLHSLVL